MEQYDLCRSPPRFRDDLQVMRWCGGNRSSAISRTMPAFRHETGNACAPPALQRGARGDRHAMPARVHLRCRTPRPKECPDNKILNHGALSVERKSDIFRFRAAGQHPSKATVIPNETEGPNSVSTSDLLFTTVASIRTDE
jgi:hypothetical protein